MAVSSSNGSQVDVHLELLEEITVSHDEAYLYVSQGLSFQEQNRFDLARDMYVRGLEKIDKALAVKCDHPGPKWSEARKMQEKMRKSAQMIKSQLRAISSKSSSAPPYEPPEMPPSYDEACEHELVAARRSFSQGELEGVGGRRSSAEVLDLFSIPEDVQLFFVSQDGSVSAPSAPASLHVFQFAEGAAKVTCSPPAWLQIGNWTYPLVPGQSPALESGYGAFLFPNVGAGRDSAVGVILPPSVDPCRRAEFLLILNQLTAFKEQKLNEAGYWQTEEAKPKAESSLSETISWGIVTGAEYVSAGLVKGASVSSDLIHKGASKARQKIRPDMQPMSVDSRLREGLRIAHDASGVALKATGFLVRKLGDLTVALGRHLAPHIREQGTRLLTSTFKSDQQGAQDAIDGVLTVAAGGAQGFSTIYLGLENAARTLAYSLSSETVNIVGHKYGAEAGEVVGNAVFSIGNLALSTHNVQALGPKSIAKRTAKDAGKAVLKDYTQHPAKE